MRKPTRAGWAFLFSNLGELGESALVVMTIVVTVMVVVIPIALRMPAPVGATPVAVILIPATLPVCIQVAAPALCFVAALSMMADGVIKPHLCLLDATLALRVVVVRMKARRRADK